MASRFRSPPTEPAATTCSLSYIRRELGQHRLSDRRMVVYLRQLIAEHGFPAPLPAPVRGGGITTDVHPRSAWLKGPVDAWIYDRIPPSAAAAIDRAAQRDAAADMDAAATNLRLVGGRDYRGGRA